MTSYITNKELSDRLPFNYIELESIFEMGEDIFNLGDQLHLGIHKNDALTLNILDCNKYLQEYTGYTKEELCKMGKTYFEKHMHPYFKDIMASQILKQIRENPNNVVGFTQYLHLYGDETEFKPLITFAKLSKQNPSSVICIDLLPSIDFKLPGRIEQIIEIDNFKLKHIKFFQQLTARETEILTLIAEGMNNAEIAECLFISRLTVETHHKNINRKLEIRHFRDIMNYALAFDLITL